MQSLAQWQAFDVHSLHEAPQRLSSETNRSSGSGQWNNGMCGTTGEAHCSFSPSSPLEAHLSVLGRSCSEPAGGVAADGLGSSFSGLSLGDVPNSLSSPVRGLHLRALRL